MYAENISREEINKLEIKSFGGNVIVVDTIEKVEEAVNYLKNQKIIGFDTENRPTFKKGIHRHLALLQLSTAERAYLVRIGIIGLDDGFAKIFEDKNIAKVGIGILEDVNNLKSFNHFEGNNFIDLQELADTYGIKPNGLRSIAAIILGFRVSKTQRTSNWEAETYTEAQKRYAATDAWVCYEIYKKLIVESK